MDKEKIIKELNIIFKENGWKLLPENNYYSNKKFVWNQIILCNYLYIDRSYIPYEKHINKFTIKKLDNYVVEFIKNIYLKYELERIVFNDSKYGELNSVELK